MTNETHLFIKNTYPPPHFILERVDVSVVCERWVETRADCYIDPNSSFDHSSTSSASLLVLLNRSRWGPQPSDCKLALTLAFLSPINSTAARTCLYSFIKPTCFRFFFRFFTQMHLWLTARSRVNIQHLYLQLLLLSSHWYQWVDALHTIYFSI